MAVPGAEEGSALSPEQIAGEVKARLARLEDVINAPELAADRKHELLATVIESLVPQDEEGLKVVLKAPFRSNCQTVKLIVIRLG